MSDSTDFDYASIPSYGELGDIGGLYDLLVDHAPPASTLVEIGVYHGRSLVHLGLAAKSAGKQLKVVGVDWFEDMSRGNLDVVKGNLQRAGLTDVVRLVVGDSADSAKFFADESVWVAFLDAAHTPHEAVARDIQAWMPKVSDGGYLAGHDYRWFSVCETANSLMEVVLHDPERDDCWLAPKQPLIEGANIHLPTTIPKDKDQPTIRDHFNQLRGN